MRFNFHCYYLLSAKVFNASLFSTLKIKFILFVTKWHKYCKIYVIFLKFRIFFSYFIHAFILTKLQRNFWNSGPCTLIKHLCQICRKCTVLVILYSWKLTSHCTAGWYRRFTAYTGPRNRGSFDLVPDCCYHWCHSSLPYSRNTMHGRWSWRYNA